MNGSTFARDLTVGNPLKQLVVFSFPFILSNVLHQMYNLVDMVVVGRFVGSAGLAAVSNGGELALLYLFLSIGFSSAGQILISQRVGAGEYDSIQSAIGTLFTFSFLFSAACTAFSVATCRLSLRLIHIPEEAYQYAYDYTMVCFIGSIPVFGYNTVSAVLRGLGDAKHPFIFISLAAILNILLDLLFVGVFGMGCFGAAFATVLAETISFVISLVFLIRNREKCFFDFRRKSFKMQRNELHAILTLGLPIALQNGAIFISMLVIDSYINACGLVAAAATAVGNKITVLATMCTAALQTSGSSMVAQNFAAGKIRRVRQTLGYILLICLVFCGILAALLLAMPEKIFAIFDKNPEVTALARQFAPIGAVVLIGYATRSAAIALMNGIGNSRLSLVVGLVDGVAVRIVVSILLGATLGMGIRGFWLGNACASQVFGVVGIIYYAMGKWVNRKRLA